MAARSANAPVAPVRRRREVYLLPTTTSLRLELPTSFLLEPRQLRAPSTPCIRLVTPMPHRGISANNSHPNFPLSPPTATSPYQPKTCHNISSLLHMRLHLHHPLEQPDRIPLCLPMLWLLLHHCWHLTPRTFLPRAQISHCRPSPGPHHLDVDWKRSTSLQTYRLHLHRGRFTHPTRSTLPSWTRQAFSLQNHNASSTGSPPRSVDEIYPADFKSSLTPRQSPC